MTGTKVVDIRLSRLRDDGTKELLVTKQVEVIPAELRVSNTEGTLLQSFSYRLPNKQDGFYSIDTNNILQLHTSLLPTVLIDLKQKGTQTSLTAPVSIRSTA